jgi:hypothetical protein
MQNHSSTYVLYAYKTRRLRHYATSRKIAGSIPDGVIRIFN